MLKANAEKIGYGIRGVLKRFTQKKTCPSCGASLSERVSMKLPYELRTCSNCELLYRWPYETASEMQSFYQKAYSQSGLTTDLPTVDQLALLIDKKFAGSEKDFARVVQLLKALSVPKGAKVLDFGANWGYGVYQLLDAGWDTIGYEISRKRAEYARNLGVSVFTDWVDVEKLAPFDMVFSSHVLEHTPNPAEALRRQRAVLSDSGVIVALFPSGSPCFREKQPEIFRSMWGRVHPVMLNEAFVKNIMSDGVLAIASICDEDLRALSKWNRQSDLNGSRDNDEMLMVWCL